MQKIKRFWWVGALAIISLPFIAYGAYYCAVIWTWTTAANRLDLKHKWQVELPQNGHITYRAYSYPRMAFGPGGDSKQTLTWTKRDGSSHEYLISMAGSRYRDLEFRLRNDHQAVSLITGAPRYVAAALNLETGRFDMNGLVMFWAEPGYSDSERGKIPEWATLTNGKLLGRKKFE